MMPSTKSETKQKPSWRFTAIGTQWWIESEEEIAPELRDLITATIDEFDKTYSRFRTDSLVYEMSQAKGEYKLPKTGGPLFDFYEELLRLSDGQVTPLIGDTLRSAGYDENYSLQPSRQIAATPTYDDVLKRDGLKIQLSQLTMIDVGAAGKGYLIDIITDVMRAHGHETFTVDASGDIRTTGWVEEVVGLENPLNTDEVIGFITIEGQALCASGINRRKWGEWHHIINPKTSRPATEIIATWAIASTAMLADGLATALFFVSPEKLSETYNYEYLRMHADGSVEYSEYFGEGLFT